MLSIDPRCGAIYSLTDSFLKTYLLLALGATPFDFKNKYDAVDDPGSNSLIIKAEIDHQSGKLTPHEVADNAILLENASVTTVSEVAVDKLLISI